MQISTRGSWMACALVVMLTALSACSKSEHAAPGRARASQPVAHKGSGGTAFDLADMVSAVSSGKAPTEIDLKFELRERPVVGEPVDIDIALIPGQEIERLYATFNVTDGLELTKGGRTSQMEHPEAGAPISHSVTIVPQRDGIFFVNATVLVDSATNSITHNFSIPVIAGAGISATGAAAPPPVAHPQSGSH